MICPIGNNTKERVMDTFITNNLISSEPRTDGTFYVLKQAEFDAENQRLSAQMLQDHNILNSFWVREGGTARFSDTFAHLVDLISTQGSAKSALDEAIQQYEADFPVVKGNVSGMAVRATVPNIGSIEASLNEWESLQGIREVSFSAFTQMEDLIFRSEEQEQRTRTLAEAIAKSGELNPLIVVIDSEGPYILEGGHRFDALRILGKPSFPARVVIDTESVEKSLLSETIPSPGLPDILVPKNYVSPC